MILIFYFLLYFILIKYYSWQVQEEEHDGDGWHAIVVMEQPQNHILSHPLNTAGKGKYST